MSTAWGKLQRNKAGEVVAQLDLVSHCTDVAAVVAGLLSIATIRRRMEALACRRLDEVDIERLTALGFLHDIGKVNVGFQSKALPTDARQKWLDSAGCGRSECGHTREIGPLFEDSDLRSRFRKAFPIDEIHGWDCELSLFLAAVSHHGTPIRFADLKSEPRNVWNCIGDYDPWQPLVALGEIVRLHFPCAFDPSAHPLPDRPAFVHAFAGLVSLADWVGSNVEPGFFPYDLAEGTARWPVARQRAIEVLKAMRIDVDAQRADLQHRQVSFGDVFRDAQNDTALQPTQLQQAMGEKDFKQVVVVEAETGSGKTETALWRFKTLFEAGEVDALAFVLPTRVSAVQIGKRIDDFVARLFPDQSLRPNVVLAVPGYLRVDGVDAIEKLPGFEVLWPDREVEGKSHLRWAAENSKRYLAAACAVGTIDQVLLSGLQVRHAHLRGFSLLRSLLVVDEVHASDLYMTLILQGILERHRTAGGHALLLSATLGVAARSSLVRGGSFRPESGAESEREQAPYPCITDVCFSRPVSASSRTKTVSVAMRPWLADPVAIAAHAAAAVERGARVLIVRNTVRGVLEAQRALEATMGSDHPGLFRCAGIACPHHGRYAAVDRELLDAAIEVVFGKFAGAGPTVLCGSQTLEQSLDIDGDLLITDLAPMDVLLQRIGRLHRHAPRERPADFTEPRVVVLTPTERDLTGHLRAGPAQHGLGGFVYPNLLSIDATWSELMDRSHLTIPGDNRALVERTTDTQSLEALAESKGDAWVEHLRNLQGKGIGQRQEALFSRLDWSKDWEASAFPDAEERIRTRLGAEAVRVPLPEAWTSPFGATLLEITVPAWMWRGEAVMGAVAAERLKAQLRVSVDGQVFSYSRLGLEKCA